MNFDSNKYSFGLPLRLLSRGKLSVFLFHKVPRTVDPLMAQDLDFDGFNRVLDFVGERFKVVPLADAVEGMQRGKLPDSAACITFDDGYASWFDGAIPALERRNMHATFFITTGQYQGLPMWHERVASAITALPGPVFLLPGFGLPALPLANLNEKRKVFSLIENYLKYQQVEVRDHLIQMLERAAGVMPSNMPLMTAEQLRNLHGRGFGVGAHTVTHPILSLCDEKTATREIGDVREVLQNIVGGAVTSFAYPNGRPAVDFGPEHVRMVKAAGYTHAVTTQWGAATVKTPIFEIPRFTPWGPSANRMALQMARNLLTSPKLVSIPSTHASGKEAGLLKSRPRRVMVVENGAGFGGAIVAMQTLLSNIDRASVECFVLTNFPIGNFASMPCVREHIVCSDRIKDFHPLARSVRAAIWGPLGTGLLFLIGRLDDLINRLPYFAKLLFHAIRIDPDIIHGNNEPNSNREAMLVAKVLRKPYVQHLRGPLGPSRHTPWLLAAPNVFIPVSRWMAGELLMAGVGSDRIRQIYDAVDLTAIRTTQGDRTLREQYSLANGTLIIAMIGMLVPWKGQRLFLEAVAQLRQATLPPVKFLIIGDTPTRGDQEFASQLKLQVEKSGLSDWVIFTRRRDDLPAILPEIDIVVSASTDPEPLGLVMLEALASGCLFVGPAHGAVTEVVEDGVSGFLFSPGSPKSLADALERSMRFIMDNRSVNQEVVRQALIPFSGAQCASRTTTVYANLA